MLIEVGKKLNKENLVNAHLFIMDEMKRREIGHKDHDGLDRATKKLRWALKKGLDTENAGDELNQSDMTPEDEDEMKSDVMLIPDFVSQVGSSIESDEYDDIDILIRQEEKDSSLQVAITKAIPADKPLHFIYNPTGPHSDYRPLFHLVMRRCEDEEIKSLQMSAKGAEEKSMAEIEEEMSGKFVVQAHTRGESVHCDMRFQVEKPEKADHLIGITLDTPGNTEKRNKLLDPEKGEKILTQIKIVQPLSWLKVGEDGPVEVDPGEVGAGENVSGKFVKVDGGTWKAGTQDPHYKEFQLEGKKIAGRWILTYVPKPGEWERAGDGERVWLFSKPEDQEMDADKDEGEKKSVKRFARIVKANPKLHIVTGVVLEPDTVDLQGDTISAKEIEKAAYRFMENYGRIGYMHEKFNKELKLVESWIAPVDFISKKDKVKKGSWLISVKVLEPDIWKAIEDGEVTGLSIGGESGTEEA